MLRRRSGGGRAAGPGEDLSPPPPLEQPHVSSGLFALLRVKASSRAVRMFVKNFSARLVSDYEIYCFYYLEVCLPDRTLKSGLF